MPLRPLILAVSLAGVLGAVAQAQGVVTGTVVDGEGRPIGAAAVRASHADGGFARETVTDSAGAFRMFGVPAGVYVVRVNRVGFRGAELVGVRVVAGSTVVLNVTLTQAAQRLSTIDVVTSPTAVDGSTTELKVTLDRTYTELLPSARDASSLVTLVPGARKDQLWGGAAGVSNDYRLDGVPMNHPGLGGDFLSLSVDWIESLELKGLGAGAEYGNFQGGVINAVTKSGGNVRWTRLRTNYEAARWTATNLHYKEQGAEQAGRREIGGETGGPIARDRLFYFAAGQHVSRDVRASDVASGIVRNFQPVQEAHDDARGMLKLTWLPSPSQRADALVGASSSRVEHAGLNGIDDPDALARVRQPAAYFGLSWTETRPSGELDVRLGGFRASETREGYQGGDVPGIQTYQYGRQPQYQNAAFNERRHPSGLSGTIQWRSTRQFLGAEHRFAVGTDVGRSHWRDEATRNGGLTWRPNMIFRRSFDPAAPSTWASTGSDWGGEVRLNATMWNAALFLQDNFEVGSRLLFTPGLRVTRWSGTLRGDCAACSDQGETVGPAGLDERLGVTWDLTGQGTFVLKAHAGRYHQGMSALFFDRAEGANAYSDARFYFDGPKITDPRTTFTVAERDGSTAGFPATYELITLSESGRVSKYRQPYVDQIVLSLERSFGSRWKAELLGTARRNRNIVGLVDRNAASNYSAIRNVRVDTYSIPGRIVAPNGGPLVLPVVYVAHDDLKRVVAACGQTCAASIAGIDTATIRQLQWDPDYVLTAVPEARRSYRQATALVRTVQANWRGEASFTAARLEGNVPGVTGYGTAGNRFTPGPFARPGEAVNFEGILPDAQQLEAKLWLTGRLWRRLYGGVLVTHTYGETYTPGFQFQVRYAYDNGAAIPTEILRRSLGQSMLLEPRGSRHYPSRDVVDAHLEWRLPRVVLAADLFNATGSDVVTRVNTNVGDRTESDPTSFFGAVRERVPPRTLRLGLRIE